MEELEDSLVGQNVQDIPRLGVDHRQPVDLVLEQGIDGIKEAARRREGMERGSYWTLQSDKTYTFPDLCMRRAT